MNYGVILWILDLSIINCDKLVPENLKCLNFSLKCTNICISICMCIRSYQFTPRCLERYSWGPAELKSRVNAEYRSEEARQTK